jgi:tubulin polyglutamylase TTLL6/13
LKFLGNNFFFNNRFDIMIDDAMKPWLLEVNHTPSFTADTPLDENIKNCLITDTLILENVMWKSRK